MNRSQFRKFHESLLHECAELSKQAQTEYTLEDNAFDNFERVGRELNLPREVVLLVYMKKHLDGITNYVKNPAPQRDTIRGRIIDAINYLSLLGAMIDYPNEDINFETQHKLANLTLTRGFPTANPEE